jgi:predicted dehydrogenase
MKTSGKRQCAPSGSGQIGMPFRARIDMISGFPVFKNQPFLAELERFIITDLGSHTLDVARFLFGEAESLYCQTRRVHPNIKGEDVAAIMLCMANQTSVMIEMAYAENYLEREVFPQTLFFIEGAKGSIEMAPHYWLRVTTKEGTPHACRRRAMRGPIRPTMRRMPVLSLVTPTCWRHCAAKEPPKPPVTTTSKR